MERDEQEKEIERDETGRLGSSFQDKGKHDKACLYCGGGGGG
jgi:hypothetical protein